MGRKEEPTRDARGMYRRDIGWKPDDKGGYAQHRFYLGRDRGEALLRCLQLERAWQAVERRWERDRRAGRPVWDDLTLQIAQAVARGEAVVRLAPPRRPLSLDDYLSELHGLAPADPATEPLPASSPGGVAEAYRWLREREYRAGAARWLQDLQRDFPFARLELADEVIQSDGEQALGEERREAVAKARRVLESEGQPAPAGGQTLHQALDAYAAWVRSNYRDPGRDGISPHANTMLTYVGLIKQHHADVALDCFGLAEIEAVIAHWKHRPKTKRDRPCSPETAKDVIKRVRHFLRWLHRSPAFRWRLPPDYETLPVRIPLTHQERSARLDPQQVQTYTLDELCTLYEYATPLERLLLLLGLNCGFGVAEVSTLLTTEIHLRQPHGHYRRDGSWVKRLRAKSSVYGEWSLWPETVAGLEWQMAGRGRTEHQALMLTRTGQPLSTPTRGNNRNQKIPNTWAKLLGRVRKDHPDFRRLSYNKLRKTAGNLVRRFSDGETAGVFLCHGQPVRADALLDLYTNRQYDKVFAALDAVATYLSPMFARAAVPFPAADAKEERPSLSRGTISRIRQLRQQGHTVAKVAELLGVSEGTVRRYSR